jgi:hypothetical protein
MLKSAIINLRRALPSMFRPRASVAAPTRLPERGREIAWMEQSVAYFRHARPAEAHLLFRRGSSLYMPAVLSVVCGFRSEHLAAYRALQKANPDLVRKARSRERSDSEGEPAQAVAA